MASTRRPIPAWLLSPCWLCLILSLITRVWLIYHAQGLVDGDESQIGIQALRILHGERPVYFYGQPYMGSLVAYLLAPLFALVGPTAWALRTESLCFSLLLIYLTWQMAGALADSARLSVSARLSFQQISALIAAVPPLYDGVVEMRVWGGYIETFVIGLWLLYSVVRLSQRWLLGIGSSEVLLRWLGIGLLVGLGFWVDPLIELPLAVCVLWLAGASIVALMTASRHSSKFLEVLRALAWNWLDSIATVPTALLGFAPALYWGYHHQWENVQYILHSGSNPVAYDPYIAAVYPTHLDRIRGVAENYLTCDAPRVLSGLTRHIPELQTSALTQLHHPQTHTMLMYDITLAIMLVCVGIAVALFLLSYVFKRIGFLRKLLTLPLLFAIVVSGAFCLSDLTERYLVHHPCDADQTGRYASLLIIVLPFMIAAVLTAISMAVNMSRRAKVGPALGRQIINSVVLMILVLYLSTQGVVYVRVAQDGYFRSPFCQISLVHTDQAQSYLKEQRIRYLWSDIWIGNVLMFRTATDVISTDPRVFTGQLIDRIPDYSHAIRSAKHASVAFFASPDDHLSERLKPLDAAHIKYRVARFTVDQGADLVILTPVGYTFQPPEAAAVIVAGPTC